MAALTRSRDNYAKYVVNELFEEQVKVSEIIYAGALVNRAAATGLVEAGDSTDGDQFAGVAYEEVTSDASGLDSETGRTAKVRVRKNGTYLFTFSGAEITDMGKEVSISDDQTVVAALPTYTTALTGTNNDLVWTAKAPYYGDKGKAITITYLDPGAVSQTESIEVHGYGIVVNLATDSSGNITSTGDTIKATLLAHTVAAAMVTAVDDTGNDGSEAVTAMASQRLTIGPSCGVIVGIESTTSVFVKIDGYAN